MNSSSFGKWLVNIRLVIVITIIATVVIMVGSLKWTLNENNYEARRFLSQFIPLLNDYKSKYGCYPDQFPKEWLPGKEIPELVEIGYFYYKFDNTGGCEFLLRFKDPDSTWADDGVFGNQSNYGNEWFEL